MTVYEGMNVVGFWAQGKTWAYLGFGVFLFVAFLMWVLPVYSVWSRKKKGEADLAEANFGEQVAIAQANARLKAADLNRMAEEIDALAVSNSVKVIGNALKNNEGYIRWQWIKMMGETDSDIIYVPTEANLPILEAGRKGMEEQ
jgi:hypothetical protein